MAGYVSEYTKFIAELMKKNPQMEEGQQVGRSLLWDKEIDREAQSRFRQASVPAPGYTYQNNVGPTPSAGPSTKGT